MIVFIFHALEFHWLSYHWSIDQWNSHIKTMTEREGDITDCISIAATQNPDWNIILEELLSQIKQSKQDIWITWVGERLDLLAERGVDIPIMKQVDKLREKYFKRYEKNHKK